ncbi:MAG: YegS/Rv2252/BmrU family lipid kinase [Bacteroidales bacterium]|nr:YegS/Rv2252/BmrU family lipid kinase [Bacteroidales bacterium]
MSKNIAFIINPISGIGKQASIEETIRTSLGPSRFNVHVFYTQAPKDGTRLALEAMKTCEIIVAVGGDGSVNDVAKALIHTDKILGIIPSGSGNGLARHLGLPLDVKEALNHLQNGVIRAIDTLTVNDKLCISIAGVGFDADVAEQFNKSKRRGFIKYSEIAVGNFLLYRPKKYRLKFNGQKLKTRALMINFANSNQFGYGFQIAPNADLTDGLMDMVVLKKPHLLWSQIDVIRFLRNAIHRSKYCQIYQTANVRLKRKNPDWVNIDGEAVWMPREITIAVHPESLNVIC